MDDLGLPPLPDMSVNTSGSTQELPSLGARFSQMGGGLGSAPRTQAPAAPAPTPGQMKKQAAEAISASKRASVEEITLANKMLHDPETLRVFGAAETNGNDLAQNEVWRDLNEMSYPARYEKYGKEIADATPNILAGETMAYSDLASDRTAMQTAGDLTLGAAQGGVSMLGGLGALAFDQYSPLRLITNPIQATQEWITGEKPMDPAVAVATLTDAATRGLKGMQSDELTRRERTRGIYDQLNEADNLADYNKAIANLPEDAGALARLGPTISRWGKDIGDSAGNLLDDPAMMGQLGAESIASLVPSIMLAKGAASLAAKTGSKLAEKVAVPLSVGLTEGGGAYKDTIMRVMAMTPEELEAGSETYRELRASGVSHGEAQEKVAIGTGQQAMMTTLPFATAAGKISEKLLLSPMSPGSLMGAVSNIGRETIEEGIQGTVGALAGNKAIQDNVDSTQDVLAGVGKATAAGMLGGAMAAGAMQGPGAALKGTGAVLEATASGVNKVVTAIGKKAEAAAEAGSSVTAEKAQEAAAGIGAVASKAQEMADEMTAAAASAPVADLATADLNSTRPPEDEQAPVADPQVLAQRINDVGRITGEEISKAPKTVLDIVLDGDESLPEGAEMNRAELLMMVAQAAQDPKRTPAEQREAVLWISENVTKLEALVNEDLSVFGANGDVLKTELRGHLTTLQNNKLVRGARESAQTAEIINLPELTPETLATPEVQRVVQETAAVAMSNPMGTNPVANSFILNQMDEGNIQLPPLQAAAVRTAAKLRETADQTVAAKAALAEQAVLAGAVSSNLRQKIDMVRDDIRAGDDKDEKNQYSLNRSVADITQAMATGDLEKAKQRLESLRNFVQHFQNKVEAYGKSAELKRKNDNTIKFRGWTGSNWREASRADAYGAYVNPFSANGVYLALAVAEDAKAIREVYNTMVESYGTDLGLEAFPDLVLPEVITKPYSLVAKAKPATQQSEKVVPNAQTSTDEGKPKTPAAGSDTAVTPAPTGTQEGTKTGSDANAGSTDQAPNQDQAGTPPAQGAPVSKPADGTGNRDGKPGDVAGAPAVSDLVGTPPAVSTDVPSEAVTKPIPKITVKPAVDSAVAAAGDFSNLMVDKTSGRNLFVESHEVDPEKGKLLGEVNPLDSMIEAMENIQDFAKQSGVTYYLDTTHKKLFQGLLQNHGRHLVNGMNKLLESRSGPAYPSIKEQLVSGGEKLLMINGRIFNLVDAKTGLFDSRLIESAAVAAIHWAITSTGSVDVEREDIARSQGISEGQVTAKMLERFRSGMQETRAAESLAKVILEFWGAKVRSDRPMNEAYGIAQQLAAEMITLMDGRLVTAETLVLKEGEPAIKAKPAENGNPAVEAQAKVPPKLLNVILLQRLSNEEEAKNLKKMGHAKHFLKDVAVKTDDPEFYFDKKPAKVKVTQKRNFLGRISDRIVKALTRHQEVRFMRNSTFMDFVGELGLEDLKSLSGYIEINEGAMNKTHQEMVRGTNNTIEHALEGVLRHETKLQEHAKTEGKDPNAVVTHFDWYQGRNGRIMAKGFTGQSIKWMREAFTPTVSVLDLSSIDSEGHNQFWITAAQAFRIKTERRYKADAVKAAQALAEKEFKGAIDMLKAWIADPAANRIDKDELIAAFEAKKLPFTPKTLHGLLAVARYQHVVENGTEAEQSEFEHMLSLEADGVTDGPVNAMMHFIAGIFSADQLENMARGGVFLGSIGKTLNQFYKGGAVNPDGTPLVNDIYQTASNALRDGMRRIAEDVKDKMGPKAKAFPNDNAFASAKALYRVLGHFGQLEFDEKTGLLVFGRGVMKNPLTISVYGSSLKGIMGKIAGAIADDLAEKMTQLMELRRETNQPDLELSALPGMKEYTQVMNDLTLLTNRRVMKKKDGIWISLPMAPSDGDIDWKDAEVLYKRLAGQTQTALRDPLNFAFTPRNMEMLEANLLTLMGNPMEEAIDSIMGETKETMKLIMGATQAQGHIFKELFKAAVEKRVSEKQLSGELTKRQLLTTDDYNAIFAEMSQYAAIVESYDSEPGEESHINLSIAENVSGDENSPKFFKSVAGKFTLGATLAQPGNVGVAAAPMLTISRGDAMMMANYYAREDSDLRTLQVYDGLEMPADAIELISQRINEASYQAWLENPTQSVADSYNNFLRRNPLSGVNDPETVNAIGRALAVKPDPDRNYYDQVVEAFHARGKQLDEAAVQIEARKRVFAKVGLSVDHMASGESPFVKMGLMPKDEEDLVGFLNGLLEVELEELRKERKLETTQPVIQKASTRMRNLARMYGEPLRDGKVSLIKPADLITLMRDAEMPEAVRDLFFAVAPKLADFSIFIGSRDELNAYHRELVPPSDGNRKADVGKGMTDVENRWMFLSNPSAETIIHEAIHAATAAMIFDHASDPRLVSEPTRNAIENLQKLMDEFMTLDFTGETGNERDALLLVQDVIIKAVQKNQNGMGQAVALNEFVAWTLSNQHVGRVLGKTKTYSKLAKIVNQVADFMRNILGLKTRTMLEAVRFNSNILFRAPENEVRGAKFSRSSTMEAMQEGITVRLEYIDLNQVSPVQDEPGLMGRAREFHNRLEMALNQSGVNPRAKINTTNKAYVAARRASNLFTNNHFGMTPNGKLLFEEMQATFAAGIQMEPKAMVRAQFVYDHVMSQLNPKSFMADPTSTVQAEIDKSERQYRALVGEYGYEKFKGDRNNLLASFLALSQTSNVMREALDKIELPKNAQFSAASADEFVNSVGRSLIDTLGSLTSKTGLQAKATVETLDILTETLGTLQKEAETKVELTASALIDSGNGKVAKVLGWIGDKSWDLAETKWKTPNKGFRTAHKRALRAGGIVLGTALSESRGEVMAEQALLMASKTPRMPKVILEGLAEVIGMTDKTWGVLRLVNQVRTKVQGIRQDFREVVPEMIAAEFKRKLEKVEWTRMHQALGKTDIGSLVQSFSLLSIGQMFRDARHLQNETTILESKLSRLTGTKFADYVRKMDETAKWMVTGEIDPGNLNLLKNAEALARLLGERNQISGAPSADLVKTIDQLVTLKAVELLDQTTKDTIASLALNEEKGLHFVIAYMTEARMREMNKAPSMAAILNAHKGYIPSERAPGSSLIVADESDQVALIQAGYMRVGDYMGVEDGRQAYYYSNVSGEGSFQQGILQTVQQSYFGVSKNHGFSVGGQTGGTISGEALKDLQLAIRRGHVRLNNKETLTPVFDETGILIAYERSMDPAQLARLDPETHIGEMLGAWAGRQAEEELAVEFNRTLVKRLKVMWDEAVASGDTAAYVDLNKRSRDDRVLNDARKLIPSEVWGMAEGIFMDGTLMVRRDVLHNVVGYRMASVTDLWTGNSNVPKEARDAFRKTATLLFGLAGQGNNTFKYLATTEKFWQTIVSEAKNTIVVRSVVIPMANLASNFAQLMVNGVSPRDILTGMTSKLLEIEQYQKHQRMRVALKGEQARYRNNPDQLRVLAVRLNRLTDAERRMSIWPLIEAGEFSTISEGMTQLDASLTSGKWVEWIQSQVERVPGKLGTVAKYAVVSRDTALFQGMSRATQYGDFLARAVLYDHLTKKKKVGAEAALRKINEEFVNYNLLPGRTRSYAESMGITWFWAFKIRAMKVALNHVRNNPLRALALSAVPFDVGMPLDDNMATKVLEGSVWGSVGPGMVANAPELNPWYNSWYNLFH